MAVADKYVYNPADFMPLEEVVGQPLGYKGLGPSVREGILLTPNSKIPVQRTWLENRWKCRDLIYNHSFHGSIEYRPGEKTKLFGWELPLFNHGKLVAFDSSGNPLAETNQRRVPWKIITPQREYEIRHRMVKFNCWTFELLDGKVLIAEEMYEFRMIHRLVPELSFLFPLFHSLAHSHHRQS